MRTKTTLAAGLLLATLTACSSSDSGGDKPTPTVTASPTAKAYTYDDCVELLEYDLEKGEPQDASGDPECAHLSKADYDKAVSEVLLANKDDIQERAHREITWDVAWNELTPAKAASVCDLIDQVGIEEVADQLRNSGAQPNGHESEMAEYYRDEKC
jgi:hypothetical protein